MKANPLLSMPGLRKNKFCALCSQDAESTQPVRANANGQKEKMSLRWFGVRCFQNTGSIGIIIQIIHIDSVCSGRSCRTFLMGDRSSSAQETLSPLPVILCVSWHQKWAPWATIGIRSAWEFNVDVSVWMLCTSGMWFIYLYRYIELHRWYDSYDKMIFECTAVRELSGSKSDRHFWFCLPLKRHSRSQAATKPPIFRFTSFPTTNELKNWQQLSWEYWELSPSSSII